mmetsp:Transcript_5914/g.8943  ORF Transcript_5914/g.8943 Transcript_5914/m.8943 type:complete len:212 (-) Transcript_5914:645-1280(-)
MLPCNCHNLGDRIPITFSYFCLILLDVTTVYCNQFYTSINQFANSLFQDLISCGCSHTLWNAHFTANSYISWQILPEGGYNIANNFYTFFHQMSSISPFSGNSLWTAAVNVYSRYGSLIYPLRCIWVVRPLQNDLGCVRHFFLFMSCNLNNERSATVAVINVSFLIPCPCHHFTILHFTHRRRTLFVILPQLRQRFILRKTCLPILPIKTF